MAAQSTPSEEAAHSRSQILSRAEISSPVDVAAPAATGASGLAPVVDTGDSADDARMTAASVVK
ncbi:hypothetical protein PF005_g16413 [Phytophthora fragariae]|uniref:Uncharacterized protein n=1 Tax=Phytophthora fragariae TaxID=53985 RepID=A0A6A3J676_9STRA|nr:hypothetical protein PF003_g23620 [Phytophthora fragariae]KAE8926353.1 hypothetical protein PF009_g23455 [Phytophthora fragariae]KAE8987835.1 hypothetical protein PF011_g19420 [Phytophthora fragariae]KAE9097484.1 hypothetical protein PF010_g15938 [Phytophthora fragariae]KAE9098527.1 hypothetical protein PF007_g16230 [Phytophthora fragariae]